MKKVLYVSIVLLIVIGCYSMPRFVSSSIPSAYYITPNKKTYENVVNCAGTVHSADVREIYLQSALVPDTVSVEVGDRVAEGDLLLEIDLEMTEKLNASASTLLRGLSGNAGAKTGGGTDWLSLASSYGLTAALSGGDIDYTKLQSAFQGGVSPAEQSSFSGAMAGGEKSILSPVSGTVTEVNIRPDSPAPAGQAAFTIADMERFKVVAAVGESDIAKINAGDEAKIRGVGFGGSVYNGVVVKIYPTARKSLTGSDTVVDVEIEVTNPDQMLKPGFSAKVEIIGGNRYNLLTVPYEAIRQDENNDEYVYVYENGKLKKKVVVTGKELTSEVEILGGINDKSIVVYNPSGLIKEGSMINLKGRAGQ